MLKTESSKIIFIPFLICSVSMAGKSLSQILNNQSGVRICHRLFVLGFALFWIGFLVVAGFICIRDGNSQMLLFTVPFWIFGLIIIKNKLVKKPQKDAEQPFKFAIIMSALLVVIVLIAGLVILIMGIIQRDAALLIAGAFFIFGSFAFIYGGREIIKSLK